jgi:hypothetical protein
MIILYLLFNYEKIATIDIRLYKQNIPIEVSGQNSSQKEVQIKK